MIFAIIAATLWTAVLVFFPIAKAIRLGENWMAELFIIAFIWAIIFVIWFR